ncbi:MAG: potassium-transporting ATPase subunit KdpA [Rickettsiales bacterium]|nr:potassium-transporting ATPase subunit KdpA [Rickettsiales bacterium]
MYSLLLIIICLAITLLCIKPLGTYIARVLSGERVWLTLIIGRVERGIYRLAGIDPNVEMGWCGYAFSILLVSAFSFVLLFAILVFQHLLPLNPQALPAVSADLAFNIAVSFITNSNWQSYGCETTLSYFSQLVGLTVQNFISASVGIAVAIALFRGIARKQMQTIGNAYADITRAILYVLLPLSLLFALVLVSQGVIQNLQSYTGYTTLEGANMSMAQGPAASQVAIKMLGTNGGGFFNANSSHPFENPTPLTNLLQLVSILLLPASLIYTFGVMAGDRRQGWILLAAMTVMFIPLVLLAMYTEEQPNPKFDSLIVQPHGSMEGKEQRIGVSASVFWAIATTATSNGSVNAMHDSFNPLTSLFPLVLMQFGEVIFGGIGSGAYGMIIYVLFTVFIGGLMVGRTPEYLGKKLGPYEIKMASLVLIIPAICVLLGSALAVLTEAGRSATLNVGSQGFSEILYAFSSASNNNGSALAGLSANSPFYNIALGICMFVGRYWLIIFVLALAGSLAKKNTVPFNQGTLPTHTPLFLVMLVGAIILLDVLTYLPALALGPIAEHLHVFMEQAS